MKSFFLASALLVISTVAASASTSAVPGRSLGRVRLGMTPAQVTRILGKPTAIVRLRGGVVDYVYKSNAALVHPQSGSMPRKLEVLYRRGRVVQIEANSPSFRLVDGFSTGSSALSLWRTGRFTLLDYAYLEPEGGGFRNLYFSDRKRGVSWAFEGYQDVLMREYRPNTLIVHRAGTRVIPDAGGELVTQTADESVVFPPN